MRLFDFELAWARAAFDAVFPETGALPHGIARLKPELGLAEVIAGAPFEPAIGLRLALWLVGLAPIVVLRRPKTIHGATPAERERVFAALLGSSIYVVRQLAVALKAMAALLYARSDAVRAAMSEAPVAVLHRDHRAAFAGANPADVPAPLESGIVLARSLTRKLDEKKAEKTRAA